MVSSLPSIISVIVIASVVLSVFAVFGLHIFKGSFYRCVVDNDIQFAKLDNSINDKVDCLAKHYKWENAPSHFDTFSSAFFTVLQLMFSKGWLHTMHDGIDARGKDLQPKQNSNPYMMLYFVALVLFSHIFLLSMFIGVIFERFNRTYEKRNGILN